MNKEQVITILSKNRDTLRGFHVKALHLFGSVLRGDEKQTSDVDLLVEFETGLRMTRVIPTASEVSIIEGVRTS
jgi:hypothetical protein